ncbi:MAG: YbhB/YbcL family Raf kinase inhibitor-like protein [Nanoarchaeota archaeon]
MKLTSPAFVEGGKIPSKYTCDGQNVNPPLVFSDVPAKAKSLVLIMDDPDIPDFVKQKFSIQVWDHWVVFNIPPETKEVAEGKDPQGRLGKNTGGKNAYGGPCPPDREHRYFFKLYALDTELDLPEGASKAEVEKAMKNHVLAEAKLMGRYERVKK